MLIISVREFTQQPTKYLTNLPVMLSRYGVPVAKLVGVTMEFKDQVPVPNTTVPNNSNIIGQDKIINSTNEEPIYDSGF
jgi:hypothetical protein